MLVPQTARDDAEKNYELAMNRQQQAQVNLGVSQAAITKAEAQVEQARAALSQSEEICERHHRFAIDGVVLSRDREVGDAVSSILTMARRHFDHDAGRLTGSVRQGQGGRKRYRDGLLGQPARITVESLQGQEIRGKG